MKLNFTAEQIDAIEPAYKNIRGSDVPNLIHDWRVLSQRVQELERVLEWYAGPAFSQTHNAAGLRQPYPILEDEGHKAREVLNKK